MAKRAKKAPALAKKEGTLARGEPWVVHPDEVAKSTAHYRTSPEIILGCIIASGTLDTSIVLAADISASQGLPLPDDQRAAFNAFRRVWSTPTYGESLNAMEWAEKIASAHFRPTGYALVWGRSQWRHPDYLSGRTPWPKLTLEMARESEVAAICAPLPEDESREFYTELSKLLLHFLFEEMKYLGEQVSVNIAFADNAPGNVDDDLTGIANRVEQVSRRVDDVWKLCVAAWDREDQERIDRYRAVTGQDDARPPEEWFWDEDGIPVVETWREMDQTAPREAYRRALLYRKRGDEMAQRLEAAYTQAMEAGDVAARPRKGWRLLELHPQQIWDRETISDRNEMVTGKDIRGEWHYIVRDAEGLIHQGTATLLGEAMLAAERAGWTAETNSPANSDTET